MKYVANNGEVFNSPIRRFMKNVTIKLSSSKGKDDHIGNTVNGSPILIVDPTNKEEEVLEDFHEQSPSIITVEATGPDEINMQERKADIDEKAQATQDDESQLNMGISETLMDKLREYNESRSSNC